MKKHHTDNYLDFGLHYYGLNEVLMSVNNTLEEIKIKKPEYDTTMQEKSAKIIDNAMGYLRKQYEDLELERKRSSNDHLANIKLAAENLVLKTELDKLKKMFDAGI